MLTSVTTKSIRIQLSCFVKNLDIEPVAEMIVSQRNGHSAIGDWRRGLDHESLLTNLFCIKSPHSTKLDVDTVKTQLTKWAGLGYESIHIEF